MRALRFHAAKDLRLEDIPEPRQAGPGQVIVRNRFVGICGTDLHEYSYGPIFIPTEPHPFTGAHGPQVLGHEFGGVVEAIGEGVTSVAIGDRVSIGDAAGYTMVKKNWFNGVNMPSIALREADGSVRVVRRFSFDDYVDSLS